MDQQTPATPGYVPGAGQWAVCHMDEGVLHIADSFRAARAWAGKYADAPVRSRYHMTGSISYDYAFGFPDEDFSVCLTIVRADKAHLQGWELVPQRTPYDADHVAYVHEAGEVTALYIPDPEHAKDPKGTWARCRESLAWWRAAGVEVIGAIVRDGRRWHWEGAEDLDPFEGGDPTAKRDALPGLRRAVARHFEHTDN